MHECQHKFKSSLDGLATSRTDDLMYSVVIFCELCGKVTFDGNRGGAK